MCMGTWRWKPGYPLSCPAGRAPCTSALPTRMACREKIPQSSLCISGTAETSEAIGQRGVAVARIPGFEVQVPLRATLNPSSTHSKLDSKAASGLQGTADAPHHHLNVKYNIHCPTNAKELHVGSHVWIQVLQILPEIRGTILGVPIVRIILFWGLFWSPPFRKKVLHAIPHTALGGCHKVRLMGTSLRKVVYCLHSCPMGVSQN